MGKNVEIKQLNQNGNYENIYPKTISNQVILQDSLKKSLGLSNTATTDETFSEISQQLSDLSIKDFPKKYLWSKMHDVGPNEDAQQLGQTAICSAMDNGSGTWRFYYGDTLRRDVLSNTYFIENLQSIDTTTSGIYNNGGNINSFLGALRGKYMVFGQTKGHSISKDYTFNTNSTFSSGIYYIPEDATIQFDGKVDTWVYVNVYASKCIKYSNYSFYTVFDEYLGSKTENEYASIEDGNRYTLLGQTGDFAKIFKGTYVGTGGYFGINTPFIAKYGVVTMGNTTVSFVDTEAAGSNIVITDGSVGIKNTSLNTQGSTGTYFIIG